MKRLGQFSISRDLVDGSPWIVQRIMSQCIIIRAELMHINNVIEYHAISHRFDLVKDGEITPRYMWKFSPETDIEAVRL